ncbi:hypothetical protein QCD79_29975, partial [Pseudomonas quasicaspiana]|nr:hypothetical protein [Pseudomonas quasicaspiana]
EWRAFLWTLPREKILEEKLPTQFKEYSGYIYFVATSMLFGKRRKHEKIQTTDNLSFIFGLRTRRLHK